MRSVSEALDQRTDFRRLAEADESPRVPQSAKSSAAAFTAAPSVRV